MHVWYARVSTQDQTVDLQVDVLTQAGCTTVYTEVISSARAERPVLDQLLETLRAGDVLVIWNSIGSGALSPICSHSSWP